ncbi:unnamed protein product [Owenia fusiformis]|uniref:Uncharacterized protein n=1 Tax=Owenia fusiformis TaxID=6347 RepID=A0A8J1TEY2_OWEFU|nr:unnamed protein product [Owenia fusiformis]
MQSGFVLYLGLAAMLLCSALTEARYTGERSALRDLLLAGLMTGEKRDLPSPPSDAEDTNLIEVLSDMVKKRRMNCIDRCKKQAAFEFSHYYDDYTKCLIETCSS